MFSHLPSRCGERAVTPAVAGLGLRPLPAGYFDTYAVVVSGRDDDQALRFRPEPAGPPQKC